MSIALSLPQLGLSLAAGGLGIAMLPAFLTREDRSLVRVLPHELVVRSSTSALPRRARRSVR